MPSFVSRAGDKLDYAFSFFGLSPKEMLVADFGSSTGGFVDCLLLRGAKRVYSVDTSYGELAWKLRNDPRVVVLERTNAMHVDLGEKVDLITIDTSWTKQYLVLSNALKNLKDNGLIISLIKPHYEANREYLLKGKLKEKHLKTVLDKVETDINSLGAMVVKSCQSPLLGKKGENVEYLFLIKKK